MCACVCPTTSSCLWHLVRVFPFLRLGPTWASTSFPSLIIWWLLFILFFVQLEKKKKLRQFSLSAIPGC